MKPIEVNLVSVIVIFVVIIVFIYNYVFVISINVSYEKVRVVVKENGIVYIGFVNSGVIDERKVFLNLINKVMKIFGVFYYFDCSISVYRPINNDNNFVRVEIKGD